VFHHEGHEGDTKEQEDTGLHHKGTKAQRADEGGTRTNTDWHGLSRRVVALPALLGCEAARGDTRAGRFLGGNDAGMAVDVVDSMDGMDDVDGWTTGNLLLFVRVASYW